MNNRKYSYILLSLVFFTIVCFVLSLSLGTEYIPFKKVLGALFNDGEEIYSVIIKEIRLPRIILSFLVGVALAIAGVIFQGIFQNPLVDPYIIGISSGAGTGASIAIIFNLSWGIAGFSAVPLMAFLGAMLTVIVVYRLAITGGKLPAATFLLAGIAMGFFLNAIMSFLMVIGTSSLQKVVFWLMGSLTTGDWQDIKVVLPYMIFGLIPIIFYLKELNLILLGEESAGYLGVDVERVKVILIISATLITAAVVAVSGIIGFIGLIMPHIARLLVGPDNRKILPVAALSGGLFLLISDNLARSLLPPLEIPVGIITALAGGPYFIYLLRKKKGEYW
jgi:iron complex transport system permease protein